MDTHIDREETLNRIMKKIERENRQAYNQNIELLKEYSDNDKQKKEGERNEK